MVARTGIKAALLEEGLTQTAWAESQGTTKKTVQDLIKKDCIVVDGRVYSPTRYTINGQRQYKPKRST